uniref:Uncharacterized protein n=1 Tax=Rhizophora mucronata TaxID=61149 RepID=A0A2P2P8J1_RHIMU
MENIDMGGSTGRRLTCGVPGSFCTLCWLALLRFTARRRWRFLGRF